MEKEKDVTTERTKRERIKTDPNASFSLSSVAWKFIVFEV